MQKKTLFTIVILCSVFSFIYLEFFTKYNSNLNFSSQIESKTEIILEKNKNNFDNKSFIKLVVNNIINVIVIKSR